MLYIQYVQFVKERASLANDGQAERAISSVFQALGERIGLEQAEHLAETLPLEVRDHIRRNPWPRPFGLREFVTRVADKEGVPPSLAEKHAHAVLSVLTDYLPSDELIDTVDRIPKNMRVLFLQHDRAA